MDLTEDIPDFVKFHFDPQRRNGSAEASDDPFQQKWNDLGQFVKQQFFTGASSNGISEVTLRSFIACAPLGTTQLHGTLWSCTFLPPHVKLTSWTYVDEQKLYHAAQQSSEPITIVSFESPFVTPRVFSYGFSELIAIPTFACVQTIFFLVSRMFVFSNIPEPVPTPSATTDVEERKKSSNETSNSAEIEVEDEITSSTYSESPIQHRVSSVPQIERFSSLQPISTDIHVLLRRWKSEIKNRGKPTVEKIAELGGITQQELKKWLTSHNVTWTQMLTQHGFRDPK